MHGLRSVLDLLSDSQRWDILLLQEVDNYFVHEHAVFESLAKAVEPHMYVRHWPGAGSVAMAAIIHSRLVSSVRNLKCFDRAMSITLHDKDNRNIQVVHVHGYQDDPESTLNMIRSHIHDNVSLGRKQIVVVGDWNINMGVKFECPREYQQHEHVPADLLENFAQAHNLHLSLPSILHNHPLSHTAWSVVPCTRVAAGRLRHVQDPSILDFAVASKDCIMKCVGDWRHAKADHCEVRLMIAWGVKYEAPKKKIFNPKSLEILRADLCEVSPLPESAWQLIDCCSTIITSNNSTSSNASRKQLRLPSVIRDMYAELEHLTGQAWQDMKDQAFLARKNHLEQVHRDRLFHNLRQGKVVSRSKKLHRIDGVKSGGECVGGTDGANLVVTNFARKWNQDREHWTRFLSFVRCYSDKIQIDRDQVDHAFKRTNNHKKIDVHGCCLAVFKLFYDAHPECFVKCIQNYLFDFSAFMKNEKVSGRVYGKTCSYPVPSDCRSILPLSGLHGLCDVILSDCLLAALASKFDLGPSFYIGGLKNTQPSEISWTVQQCIEKGNDHSSDTSVASSDIEKYYDNIPSLDVCVMLKSRGIPASLLAAIILVQMCPLVTLTVLGVSVAVPWRNKGALTGSRVAGALGHALIYDSLDSCSAALLRKGWVIGRRVFCLAIWIDNCYAFSSSRLGAIEMLEILENCIFRKWQLKFKPSSLSYLGGIAADYSNVPPRWNPSDSMLVLGHTIYSNAGIRAEWRRMRARMWGVFWKNSGSKEVRDSSFEQKCSLLCRTVLASVSWLFTTWPFQSSVATELDQLQSHMCAILAKITRLGCETLEEYCKRRNHIGRKLAGDIGFWSSIWAARVVEWDAHITRSAQYGSFLHEIQCWRGSDWLVALRLQFVSSAGSEYSRNRPDAGRLGTRGVGGKPQPRWHEGVALAKQLSSVREHSLIGQTRLGIASRIRQAQSFLSDMFNIPG